MQAVEFGVGRIRTLKNFLEIEKPKKILLLRGRKSYGFFEKRADKILEYNFVSFIISTPHISLEYLCQGIKFYEKNNCDLILAIGGGSVIDMGKLISIFSVNRAPFQEYLSGKRPYQKKSNKLIAVPTTAGSGSEVTHFAVVYDGITKYSVSHHSLLPDYSVVDPELTYSLPPHQTAVSGMDALCQGIESFWSLNSTSESRKFSREAISIVLQNIERAVLNPDEHSRLSMCRGSHVAGKAINIAKTTGAHALSYPLTKFFGIPHGHAVSLSIGLFYEHNCRIDVYNEGADQGNGLINTMTELNKIMHVENGREAKQKINTIMERIGLSLNLPNTIDYDLEVSRVIENVNMERLANHPVKVETSDLMKIFKSLCQ